MKDDLPHLWVKRFPLPLPIGQLPNLGFRKLVFREDILVFDSFLPQAQWHYDHLTSITSLTMISITIHRAQSWWKFNRCKMLITITITITNHHGSKSSSKSSKQGRDWSTSRCCSSSSHLGGSGGQVVQLKEYDIRWSDGQVLMVKLSYDQVVKRSN